MSFIDERKTMRYASKRRVKEEEDPKKKKVKFKGAACTAFVALLDVCACFAALKAWTMQTCCNECRNKKQHEDWGAGAC